MLIWSYSYDPRSGNEVAPFRDQLTSGLEFNDPPNHSTFHCESSQNTRIDSASVA